jgi:hypothetical protein
MSKIQVIEKDGVPAFVVLPIELWARVRESVEDAEAIAALERFDREDDGTRVPIEVVRATQQEGRHVVTLRAIARALSVSVDMLVPKSSAQ